MKPFVLSKTFFKIRKYASDYIADYINLVTLDKPCRCKKCGGTDPENNVCTPEPPDGIDFNTRNVDMKTTAN